MLQLIWGIQIWSRFSLFTRTTTLLTQLSLLVLRLPKAGGCESDSVAFLVLVFAPY